MYNLRNALFCAIFHIYFCQWNSLSFYTAVSFQEKANLILLLFCYKYKLLKVPTILNPKPDVGSLLPFTEIRLQASVFMTSAVDPIGWTTSVLQPLFNKHHRRVCFFFSYSAKRLKLRDYFMISLSQTITFVLFRQFVRFVGRYGFRRWIEKEAPSV